MNRQLHLGVVQIAKSAALEWSLTNKQEEFEKQIQIQ
jgi:hypothetical protein